LAVLIFCVKNHYYKQSKVILGELHSFIISTTFCL